MLYGLADIYDDYDRFEGKEVTVRCRIRSDPMSGEKQGQKTLYEIDDPRGDLDRSTFLSFWTDDPDIPGVSRTAEYVLDSLDQSPSTNAMILNRGERVLIRGVPKKSTKDGERQLFINVTSIVIRSPELQIGKGEMGIRSQCERRYYLNFVKKVYNPSFPVNGYRFRGDVVHRVAERAIEERLNRFTEQTWTEDDAKSYLNEVLDEEFGIRMAQLSIAGVGLWGRDEAEEIIARLFTSERFCNRLDDTTPEDIRTEQALAVPYGFRGDVDLIIDGVPYDFKTSGKQGNGRYDSQIKLYLLGLLLERADVGDSLQDLFDDDPTGYIVYPNLNESESVRLEKVTLNREDVHELLQLRNQVTDARDSFGPPSPYNRDCEGCSLRTEDELVSLTDDDDKRAALPSACKHHCQSERRWPCYELTDSGDVTSECSLFDECDERLEFRNPERVDHYNRLRGALETEEAARRTASDLLDQLDQSILRRSGRLLTGLSLSTAAIGFAGFEMSENRVPAFAPGDTVTLKPETEGAVGKSVTYLGRINGEYRFQFDIQQHLSFLRDDVTYRVQKSFEPENVSRKFLPYLDYAQRRGHNRRFEHEEEIQSGEASVPTLDEPKQIVEYLDNEEIFLDIPTRPDRPAVLGGVVNELVTSEYPCIDGDNSIPEESCRGLILGATPAHVEIAEQALPDRSHFRMDEGGTGEQAIRASDSYHKIQTKWRESRSLLSSVQYALETEQFHSLIEGSYGDRDHSDRFFDVVILLGSESLTEPEYLFLTDLADRVVAIGDRRALGPSMVSSEATERGLDRSYFTWAYDRYASLPTEDALSLQFPGKSSSFVRELYPEDEWRDAETTFSYLEIEGGETVASESFELQASVRARNGAPFELVFDASDTTANPFAVQSTLESRDYLDATALHEGEVVLIDDLSLWLREKRQINENQATHHQIRIRIEASTTPEFGRAFLYNRPEARIVAQVADEFDAEFVVTPFQSHANELREQLDEQGSAVEVVLPEHLDSGVAGRAVVSFGVSNEAGILHPPLNDPSMLYRLFSCAEDILLVGHGPTLRSKRDLEHLVDETAQVYDISGKNAD